MKLNIDNSNLFPQAPAPSTNILMYPHPSASRPILSLTPTDLRTWWQNVPEDEKERICKLDAPDVMLDLANAANNALVVCKLNHTYKKKDLVSWNKSKDEDGGIISQTFEFNLSGKEVLDDHLADLFSTFYITVVRAQRLDGNSSNHEEHSLKDHQPKSHISVMRKSFDSILDLLSLSVPNFAQGDKFLFQRKDFTELYFCQVKEPPSNVAFDNLPLYLKVLFERLSIYSFILEYQIYLHYNEDLKLQLSRLMFKGVNQMIPSRTNSASPIVKDCNTQATTRQSTPLMSKTVSQMERGYGPEPIGDQNSTASGSPRNPINLGSPANLDMEELNQRLLQKSLKEQSSVVREISYSDPQSEAKKLQEELTRPSSRTSSSLQYLDLTSYVYEGFLLGDLQIVFDPTDALLLVEDDRLSKSEGSDSVSEQEERDFGIITEEEIEELLGARLQVQDERDKDESLGEENALQLNMDGFNMAQNNGINYTMGYPGPQSQYFYGNAELCSPYYAPPQGFMLPYSQGMPVAYMAPANIPEANCPPDNQNYYGGYSRQKPYEFQGGYGSNYGEYYKNEYDIHGNQAFQQEYEKPYYPARDRPKYDMRPKLPPRLQKKKENMLRT